MNKFSRLKNKSEISSPNSRLSTLSSVSKVVFQSFSFYQLITEKSRLKLDCRQDMGGLVLFQCLSEQEKTNVYSINRQEKANFDLLFVKNNPLRSGEAKRDGQFSAAASRPAGQPQQYFS